LGNLKQERMQFAEAVAKGEDKVEAYLDLFPKTERASAKRTANRWADRPEVKARIAELVLKPQTADLERARVDRETVKKLITQRAADEVVELIHEVKADRHYVMDNLVTIVERCMQREMVHDKDGNQTYVATAEGQLVGAFTFDAKNAIAALRLIGLENQMFAERVNLKTSLLDKLPAEVLRFMQSRLVEAVEGNTLENDGHLVDRPASEG